MYQSPACKMWYQHDFYLGIWTFGFMLIVQYQCIYICMQNPYMEMSLDMYSTETHIYLQILWLLVRTGINRHENLIYHWKKMKKLDNDHSNSNNFFFNEIQMGTILQGGDFIWICMMWFVQKLTIF